VLRFEYEMSPTGKAWSSAGGAILGGSRNFRRWGLNEGSRPLE
jgi:hypothetical protein